MTSILGEDLEDVKILIIPEVSDMEDDEDTKPVVAELKDVTLDRNLQQKIAEYLKSSSSSFEEESHERLKRKKSIQEEYENSEVIFDGEFLEIKKVVVDSPKKPDTSKRKHTCKLCDKAFNHKSTLSRHKLLTHSANPPTFICAHCNKSYKTKVNLRRHLQNVASSSQTRKTGLKVSCALCKHTCSKSEMVEHYEGTHHKLIERETLRFASEEEFLEWKHQTEIATTARFTKIRKDRVVKDGTKECFYRCHRDGVYKPRGNNLRSLKKLGSNKINGHCPAKMQVWVNLDAEVSVTFVKTHVGHDMELSRLNLTKIERDYIAQQLALQVPFDKILESCRESAVGAENIRRMNLLTRKDLYNIESSYSLSKLTHRNCLGVNVDPWVKEMITNYGDSFIKFYKPQGEILEDYPNMNLDDFVLVLMNEAQVEILKCGGNDCVCVDIASIGSDLTLMTLLVLDERDQGFPVAFLLANDLENHIVEAFFTTLRDTTANSFKPKVFISCLDDSVYKAWNSVMSLPSFRIFSPWIVDEDWRSNLDKISNPVKQVEFYTKLLSVMEISNVQTFEEELDSIFKIMKSDAETEEFADFFEMYKVKASAWAHCFRAHLGLHVNEQLERIQAALKIIYECKMKKVSFLDKFICSLMSSVKEHLFDSLISFNNDFVENMKNEHKNRHALAVEIPKNSLCKKPRQWNVSIPDTDKVYRVRILNQECNCAHSCPECQACMHGYICSCVDSSLKWVVCEHVHVVCMKIKIRSLFPEGKITDKPESPVFTEESDKTEDPTSQTDLIINVPESAYQYMTVPADGDDDVLLTFETEEIGENAELILGYAEEDPDVSVEERRSLLAQKCQNILNRISSEAQVVAFEQAMASLETDVTFIE